MLSGGAAQFAAHGFLQPSQLVQDARRHGVRVLPADVLHSHWDCTLEGPLAAVPGVALPQPAVRLGCGCSGLVGSGCSGKRCTTRPAHCAAPAPALAPEGLPSPAPKTWPCVRS
jgi:error-prone DNA polymerase